MEAVTNAASTAVTWVTNGVQSIVAAIGNSGGTSGSIPQKIGTGDTVLETTLDIDVVTLSVLNRHLCSAEARRANAYEKGGKDVERGGKEYLIIGEWWYRIERGVNPNNMRHIEVFTKYKSEQYSQSEDGKKYNKNTKPGEPPNTVKKKLKEKGIWNWDANKEKHLSKTQQERLTEIVAGYKFADGIILYEYIDPRLVFEPRNIDELATIYYTLENGSYVNGSIPGTAGSLPPVAFLPWPGGTIPIYVPGWGSLPALVW
jgi:hypothetical protein